MIIILWLGIGAMAFLFACQVDSIKATLKEILNELKRLK